MSLPEQEHETLLERGITFEVIPEAGITNVVFPNWPLPPGFDQESADLLVRLPAGFPDVPPDMWWFHPPVRLVDGNAIPATEVIEVHLGRDWQRWSRHFTPGQWNSGVDGIENYLALIARELLSLVPAA